MSGPGIAPDARGEFAGYGSLFNVVDLGEDIVLPGAFVNLADFGRTGSLLWSHDLARPVAVPLEARDDGIGLWVRGRFHSTPGGQEARTIVEERQAAGNPFGLSIGYVILKSRNQGLARLLEKLYLIEISLVAAPMNHGARVQVAKTYRPADLTPARIQSSALAELMRAHGVPIR